jgi:hypothetical protein
MSRSIVRLLVLAALACCAACHELTPCLSNEECDTALCERGYCAPRCDDSGGCPGKGTTCQAGICVDNHVDGGEGEGSASEGEGAVGEGEGEGGEGEGGEGEGEGEGGEGEGEGGEGEGGEGEGEGEGNCAPFVDSGFDGPSIDPTFTAFQGTASTSAVDGDTSEVLLRVPAGDNGDYTGIDSAFFGDFSGAVVQWEVDGAGATGVDQDVTLISAANGNNEILAELDQDNHIQLALINQSNFVQNIAATAFDPIQDRVWRLVLDANALGIDTSPDGHTFQRAETLPLSGADVDTATSIIANSYIEIEAGAFEPGTAEADFRLMSVSAFPSAACADSCAPTRLDLRQNGNLSAPFTTFASAGATVAMSRGATVTLPSSSTGAAGIDEGGAVVDLRGAVIDVRLVDARASHANLQVFFGATLSTNNAKGIRMETSPSGDGKIHLALDLGSGSTQDVPSSSPYSSTNDRVWRLVLDPNGVHALTSSDGATFVDRGMVLAADARIAGFLQNGASFAVGVATQSAQQEAATIASVTIWPSLACAP